MLFAQVPGASDVKKLLIQVAEQKKVAHAQLFIGKEGGAQLGVALAYATYLNCENPTPEDACGTCRSCRNAAKLMYPDLHFVLPTAVTKKVTKRDQATTEKFLPDWRSFITEENGLYKNVADWVDHIGGENKQAIITRQESREIIKALSVKAHQGGYKIVLIWMPELMQAPAANAVLKILEEPPEKTLFFMVTNDAEKLIATILSRTQKIYVPTPSDEDLTSFLVSQDMEPEKAKRVAFLSDGNIREALRIASDVPDQSEHLFKSWMRSCFKASYTEIITQWSEEFNKLGKEGQKNFFKFGLTLLREAMLIKNEADAVVRLDQEAHEFAKNFSSVLTDTNLPVLVNSFNDAYYFIERNGNAKIIFVSLSIKVGRAFGRR
ncbi:DNA polymerase III subunit delta [Flammeovirga pectinis]|uniref:DNA polymerase III subunit delta n=1 Tax=Flammeovirga pectinis TaxID=2494373 RepID=A0A3Q9FLY0_9BACT|nr:DNA polymerase III subunit delta [Flammeovirga pectinis]AZQ60826.1 DNA polymerase III subunit delta [Flammeovirga pectinis]